MTFPHRSPMSQALDLADRDIKGLTITPAELDWLRSHPVTWLKALTSMKTSVELHIKKSRSGIEDLKPAAGEAASREYTRAKQAMEKQNLPRFHFLEKVVARAAEVKSYIGYEQIQYANDAEFVDRIQNAVRLIREGKTDHAVASLEGLLSHIEKLHYT